MWAVIIAVVGGGEWYQGVRREALRARLSVGSRSGEVEEESNPFPELAPLISPRRMV